VTYRKPVRIPRSARTVQLVVNLPEPRPSERPQPPQDPSKRSAWGRLWAIAKVAGPVCASLAALFIAIAALRSQDAAVSEQRKVDRAAAAASQLEQAEKVYFIVEDPAAPLASPQAGALVVQNASTSPVDELTFYVVFTAPGAHGVTTGQSLTLDMETMPSCARMSFNIEDYIAQALRQAQGGPRPQIKLVWAGLSMSFSDNSGQFWQESGFGPPRHASFTDLPEGGLYLQINPQWTAAPGCS
jgi:hypothetical protein